jgi:hypothetical protein
MIIYLIVYIVALIISIFITRAVFEIPKFSKRADDVIDVTIANAELLKKQNQLLSLLVQVAYENKKIGLINKTNGAVKVIDVSELKDYDLEHFDIQVLAK